ncbi:MAG: hypothetical protein JWO74_3266 [Solirubrobacterales bacterium]|nr:hypothetical protein [Solirubrobacterales bacterium]
MRGRRAALYVAAWALILALLAVPLFLWHSHGLEKAQAPAAVLVTLVIAALALAGRNPSRRVLPDASAAPFLIAAGLTLMAAAWAVGPWAAVMGGWCVVIALVVLARERAA